MRLCKHHKFARDCDEDGDFLQKDGGNTVSEILWKCWMEWTLRHFYYWIMSVGLICLPYKDTRPVKLNAYLYGYQSITFKAVCLLENVIIEWWTDAVYWPDGKERQSEMEAKPHWAQECTLFRVDMHTKTKWHHHCVTKALLLLLHKHIL